MKYQIQIEKEEITVVIRDDDMATKNLLADLQLKADKVNEHHSCNSLQEKASRINRGLAIYGVARGLLDSIGTLEDGSVEQGAVGLVQSLHGIGERSGVNRTVYKQSVKVLGTYSIGIFKTLMQAFPPLMEKKYYSWQ